MPLPRFGGAVEGEATAAAERLGSVNAPVLLRLPFSHFCKKAEWGLTYAGIPYRTLDVTLRGMRQVKRANPGERTVPVLVTGTTIVPGSHAILEWANGRRASGTPPFYPHGAKKAVLAWEAWADSEVGPAVRREAYRVMAEDPSPYARGTWTRLRLRMARPAFRTVRDYLKADKHAEADRDLIPAAIAKTAAQLAERGTGFLFADHLTGADLASAALMEPLLAIAKVRAHFDAPGWEDVATFVKRVKPTRLRRTAKRAVKEADWRAFEVLHRAAGTPPHQPAVQATARAR